MKDALDSVAVGHVAEPPNNEPSAKPQPEETAVEHDGFANRKLIRPSLQHRTERSERAGGRAEPSRERSERPAPDRPERPATGIGRKAAPPDQTHAEGFYYQKQMQSKTPMVVVLNDGEEVRGVIEWYDKNCIKLNRDGPLPNLLIYKPSIKYLFKESEGNGRK